MAAIEKLNWYALRWKIETFYKILKSCCKAEKSKLRTADRLTNLIAISCILSWRIFWMTIISRSNPDSSPDMVLTPTEIQLLDNLVVGKSSQAET
jgi:IS4 transposase